MLPRTLCGLRKGVRHPELQVLRRTATVVGRLRMLTRQTTETERRAEASGLSGLDCLGSTISNIGLERLQCAA